MAVSFTIPGRPVAWARAGRGNGATFTPAPQRSFAAAVRMAGGEAMAGRAPLEGAVRLIVAAHFPIAVSWSKKKQEAARQGEIRPTGKPDWDNAGKIISDALNGIAYRDDAQIVSAVVDQFYSDRPRVDVRVEAI